MNASQTLISYSQFSEDITLLQYLYKIDNGFYLDIGANDPAVLSVTKMFYNAGWRGVNIEPLPAQHKLLESARPRDINIRAAAGSTDKTQALYQMGVMSTFMENMVRNKRRTPRLAVQVRNTTSLVREVVDLKTQPIHFCKIDVEGYEEESLKGIDFKTLRPWMFVIEANHVTLKTVTGADKEQRKVPVWEDILIDNGYSFTETVAINRYYVDNAHPELLKGRLNRPELLKMFNIISAKTKQRIQS
jgi:FkbM family methyltransferase